MLFIRKSQVSHAWVFKNCLDKQTRRSNILSSLFPIVLLLGGALFFMEHTFLCTTGSLCELYSAKSSLQCFKPTDKQALYLVPQPKLASFSKFQDFFFLIFLLNLLSVQQAPTMCLELHIRNKIIIPVLKKVKEDI